MASHPASVTLGVYDQDCDDVSFDILVKKPQWNREKDCSTIRALAG